MDKISKNTEVFGFDNWFIDNADPLDLKGFDIARVVAVHKDSYILNNGENEVFAVLVGRMRYGAESPIDFPAVGDWVLAVFYDENSFSVIHHVLGRKSVLKRKTPGKRIDFQLIATNIDVALIVQSLDADFNLRRLERYSVMAKDSGIEPVVLLSKSDLISTQAVENQISEIHKTTPSLHVQAFSNESEAGLEQVKNLLVPRKTYCLLGSSGVGKTTLVNKLTGDAVFKTNTVRNKDSKGRHTTTHRHLIMLDCGAMLIDTPGMRELGNISVDAGIDETFTEIAELSEKCRFNDCSHINEKGCAILSALENGELSEKRYQNYIKMKKESDYNEMSYLEKRQKEKQFGKMCKTVMKHKKNR